jgi:hypothetical protein
VDSCLDSKIDQSRHGKGFIEFINHLTQYGCGYFLVCFLEGIFVSVYLSTPDILQSFRRVTSQEYLQCSGVHGLFQRNLAGITPWGASPRIDLYSFIDSTLDNSQIAVPDRTNPIYADMMP